MSSLHSLPPFCLGLQLYAHDMNGLLLWMGLAVGRQQQEGEPQAITMWVICGRGYTRSLCPIHDFTEPMAHTVLTGMAALYI